MFASLEPTDRSHDTLRSAVVHVPHPALAVSPDDIVVAANDAARALLGSDPVGRRLEEVAADGDGTLVLRDLPAQGETTSGMARREAVLQAVAFATERMLRSEDWEGAISDVLRALGETLDVSRAYLFEVLQEDGYDTIVRQRFEWAAPGIEPQIDDPALQALPLESVGFERWRTVMATGGVIHGHVAEMPASERALLTGQGIVSLLAVPIEVEGRWWGFIGFDECRGERVWSPAEIDTLRVAAGILAVTMQQHAARYVLQRSAEAYADAYRTERDAVARLEALDAMKDGLIEAVSHEVRTPLAAVMGFAETLQRIDLDADPRLTRELLSRLSRNTTRLRRLLADLLDLNRSTGQPLEIAPAALELGPLVAEVVEDLDWLLEGREVQLDLRAELAFLDPYVVSRILQNLVRNAAHHTPIGSRIRIRTERLAGGRLLLEVEDDGPGIPEGLEDAMFEPFRRGPAAPRHAPGTGVGLTVVSRLAEAHGGSVRVCDRHRGGCRMRVELREGRLEHAART